jgi:hypothetical protein
MAKIILTEEGTMTCKPLGEYDKWQRIFRENNGFNGVDEKYQFIDWNRVDEIWLLEPRLFDQSLKRKVEKIDLTNWIQLLREDTNALRTFNALFDYRYTDDEYRVAYFDSYFSTIRILPLEYDKFLLRKLVQQTKRYRCCVKPHPGEDVGTRNLRYLGLDVDFCSNTDLPWEVICLQRFLCAGDKKFVAVSQASSSAYNTLLLATQFGFDNCYVVILHELIRKYLSVDLLEDNVAYTERAIDIYGPDKIFVPKNFAELDAVWDKIFPGEVQNKDYNVVIHEDKNWFEGQYEKNCKFLPSTFVYSGLTIDAGNGWMWETSIYQACDVGETAFEMEFEIDTSPYPVAEKVMWRPFLGRQYARIKIAKMQYDFGENRFIDIPISDIYQNGRPVKSGFIEFDRGEAFLEIVLHTTLKGLRVCGEVWFEDYHYRLVDQINQLMRDKTQKLQEYDLLENDKQRIINEAYSITQERNEYQAENKKLHFLLNSITQERDTLQNGKNDLILELQNIYNSKSWRLTKPLRIIGKALKKVLGK